MKRQNDETEALVYAYGAQVPLDDPHLQEEMRKQRAFWDALVEADHAAERELDDKMKAACPEYAAAVQTLIAAAQALREAIESRNAERAKTRSKTTSMDATVRERVAERNTARKEVWRIAGVWHRENKETVAEHQERQKTLIKGLRQNSGLYWGNYNRVINSFNLARQQVRKTGRRLRPSDPSRDNGILAVQIQRTKSGLGAAGDELFGGKFAALQIEPPPPGIEFMPTNQRRREGRVTARMRVDATGHMLEFPVTIHRPLPAVARIKTAQLVWRREGERWRGQLCLTVSKPRQEVQHPATAACGIDLGWRLQKDRALRVATVLGSDGALHTYTLPADWMSGMDQVERLSEHLANHAVEIGTWLQTEEAPADLRVFAANWNPRRSSNYIDTKGLHDAVRARNWDVPEPVRHWYKRYRHLLNWRDNLRVKLLRRRREAYRMLAVELTSRYAIIGIDNMNLSQMARTKKRDDASDPKLHAAARAQRQRAAVHKLRTEIAHQARKRGASLVHEAAKATARCGACGEVTGQTDRSQLIWTCEHCSAVWDQDHNAARNLLATAVGTAIAPPANAGSTRYDLTQPVFREISQKASKRAA